MSVEPGSPVAALPTVGIVELTLLPPPESAIARPMPMPASTTTATAIASTRGFACRRADAALRDDGRRLRRRRAPCLLRFLAARHRREE